MEEDVGIKDEVELALVVHEHANFDEEVIYAD